MDAKKFSDLIVGDEVVVEVTADDIANGARKNCRICPVALALCRACTGGEPQARADVTGNERMHVVSPCGAVVSLQVDLTGADRVGNFIYEFDSGRPMEPFQFTAVVVRARYQR